MEGCFGQSVLIGSRRTATHICYGVKCEHITIDRNDIFRMFTSDAKSSVRFCRAVLDDYVRESRHRYLMKRFWLATTTRGTRERAALIIALK
jgi:hypothetical protein